MDHVDLDLIGRKLDERVGQRLHGTVHIALDDDVEFLEIADGDTAAYLLKGHVLLGLDALDAEKLLALVGNVLGLLLVSHHIELLTRRRSPVESEHRYRCRRTRLRDLLSTLVEHRLDPAVVASAEHNIPLTQSPFLHKYRSQISTSLVERRLYDGTDGKFVRIGLEFKKIRFKKHLLKKFVHIETFLG